MFKWVRRRLRWMEQKLMVKRRWLGSFMETMENKNFLKYQKIAYICTSIKMPYTVFDVISALGA